MRRLTVSIPHDAYRAVHLHAAERGTTVTALVAECLRSLSEGGDAENARLRTKQQRLRAEIEHFFRERPTRPRRGAAHERGAH